MSPQLQTLKVAQAVIADLSPMDQDLVKSIAGQYRAILDTEGEFAVIAFALVGAEIAASARFRTPPAQPLDLADFPFQAVPEVEYRWYCHFAWKPGGDVAWRRSCWHAPTPEEAEGIRGMKGWYAEHARLQLLVRETRTFEPVRLVQPEASNVA